MTPPEAALAYNVRVEELRRQEYPALEGITYLDHAGTTLYARSLMEAFSKDMIGNLFGNPHTTSIASQRTSLRVDNVRLRVLRLFKADPNYFDLVFVANATAGIKLVADAFVGRPDGFRFGYHRDAHTSLIGVRETAQGGSDCFASDQDVEQWLAHEQAFDRRRCDLFAYPAQSNMNGRRLPLDWCGHLRSASNGHSYSLLDAAALVSTSPLDLSGVDGAPDFTVLSFNKIFGFPDLGALIVRKAASPVFNHRKYFGGGTVDAVACLQEQWHIRKQKALHERLEDGTLPFHSILAVESAIHVHTRLFGSLEQVSLHTKILAQSAYTRLSSLRHRNGRQACTIYQENLSNYDNLESQGPVVGFNIQDSHGKWASNHEVQKIAAIQNIELRTGSLCNPAGVAHHIGLQSDDLRRFYNAGHRCDNEKDIQDGKPVGMIRISFGAMSTLQDIDKFIRFLEDFFIDKAECLDMEVEYNASSDLVIEELSIYPIKSCGAWSIPPLTRWPIRKEGLAWDREWCLVHQGTYATLSLKGFPHMALFRPTLDISAQCLRVHYAGPTSGHDVPTEVSVPLALEPSLFSPTALSSEGASFACSVGLCGDSVQPLIYASSTIHAFFSRHLSIPVYLARLPSQLSNTSAHQRLSKLRTRPPRTIPPPSPSSPTGSMPGTFPGPQSLLSPPPSPPLNVARPLLGSNESPILIVSAASVEHINRAVIGAGDDPVDTGVFRANITVGAAPESSGFHANTLNAPNNYEQYDDALAFQEDRWRSLTISPSHNRDEPNAAAVTEIHLDVLGPCRRCQIVCVDPRTGARRQQPFKALAHTRKRNGGVWFGAHTGLALDAVVEHATIAVGDQFRAGG